MYGAKSFEDGGMLLTSRERHQALATPGVKAVHPARRRASPSGASPTGGSTRVVIVGTDAEDGGLDAVQYGRRRRGRTSRRREAVAVDRTYLSELGINGMGDTAQIGNSRVRVRALTDGVRSFTQSPYMYTTLNRARSPVRLTADGIDLLLVKLEPGADVEKRARSDPAQGCLEERGADQGRVPRPQPEAVAVRDRRRRGADRRRPARAAWSAP